jgi:hypothetical protein
VLRHFQGVRKEKTAYCTERTIVYPNIPSALRPVEHDDSLPIRKTPQPWTLRDEEPTNTSPEDEPGPSCSNVEPDFPELTVPHLISQSELKDLLTDPNISKIQAVRLVFRLQELNFLQQAVKMSYRKRQQSLSEFFLKNNELFYCNDVEGLLQKLGCTHNPEEWRLFVG